MTCSVRAMSGWEIDCMHPLHMPEGHCQDASTGRNEGGAFMHDPN